MGLLYRPFNQFSFGLVTRFNDNFSTYYHSTLGVAIRPFLQHRLTFGADINLYDDNEPYILSHHITLEPLDGIFLSARSNTNYENFHLNIAFNFGKETIYNTSEFDHNGDYSTGFGYYSDTQQQKSIFKKNINLF